MWVLHYTNARVVSFSEVHGSHHIAVNRYLYCEFLPMFTKTICGPCVCEAVQICIAFWTFRETYRFSFHGLCHFISTPEMKAIHSSYLLITTYKTTNTALHPKNHNWYLQRRQNHKSQIMKIQPLVLRLGKRLSTHANRCYGTTIL